MKVSLKTLTLVGVLLFAAQAEARRNETWGKLGRPRPGMPGRPNRPGMVDRADCMPDMGERCPCTGNKPKPAARPKPAPRAEKMADQSCMPNMGMRCPCNKPKPKQTPRVEQKAASFRSASVMEQRKQLAAQVAEYMSNPCAENAEMLTCCAQMYCERVNNQAMNKMVQELMSSTNKQVVQMKIMRTLEV